MGRRFECWGWVLVLLAGCDVVLVRGVAEDRARELVAEFDQQGIAARAVPDAAQTMRLEMGRASVPDAVSWLMHEQEREQPPADAAAAERTSWVETRSEQRQREAQALSRALAGSLARLPDVVEARVHLSLPSGMALLPEAQAQPAASVLLLTAKQASSQHAAVQELVAGAVPGLAPSAVRVVEALRPQWVAKPEQLTHVGPIAVATSSATALRVFAATSLVLHILLASALLWPLARRVWPRRFAAR